MPYGIIEEVQTKISRLKRPRHMSCRAILIHVNGVDEDVTDDHYFAKIINFSAFIGTKV